jgi:hypothetical protein
LHYDYPPAAWLGLSQLHTLRGVSLNDVPVAAIAAALPRLHTLHLDHIVSHVEFSVAAFYDELLPRLRSFHLEGKWPETSDETKVADVSPLSLLEDLKWFAWGLNKLPRPLMGARPSTLDTSSMAVADWLKAADGAGAGSPPVTSPVARVRALTLRLPDAAFVARLLRAAPHLRQLTLDFCDPADLRWVLSDVPACAGLAHSCLRHVVLVGLSHSPLDVPDGCGARLRQRHFPRLRRLTMDDEEYPV